MELSKDDPMYRLLIKFVTMLKYYPNLKDINKYIILVIVITYYEPRKYMDIANKISICVERFGWTYPTGFNEEELQSENINSMRKELMQIGKEYYRVWNYRD